jgi:hypothetical protein
VKSHPPFIKMKFSQLRGFLRFRCNFRKRPALSRGCFEVEEMQMKRTAIILATVAALGAAAVVAPAPAEARGLGPGLAFGLAAGAIGAGIAASTYPYGYYGPGYGYYGPRYYRPAFYGGPYAYYGGPVYRHRYWRHRHYW